MAILVLEPSDLMMIRNLQSVGHLFHTLVLVDLLLPVPPLRHLVIKSMTMLPQLFTRYLELVLVERFRIMDTMVMMRILELQVLLQLVVMIRENVSLMIMKELLDLEVSSILVLHQMSKLDIVMKALDQCLCSTDSSNPSVQYLVKM
jgi:hypothetical protein